MLKKTLLILISLLLMVAIAGFACSSDDDDTDDTNGNISNAAKEQQEPQQERQEPSNPGGSITLANLIPQRANLIASVGLEAILEDADFQEFYDNMSVDDLLGELRDLNDMEDAECLDDALDVFKGSIEDVMIFGDISEAPEVGDISGTDDLSALDEFYLGVVIKGDIDMDALVDLIECGSEETVTSMSYNGYQIYTDSLQEMALAAVGSDGIAIGSMTAVEDVIDIREGDQSTATGRIMDIYDDLGNPMLKLAMVLPPEALSGEDDAEGMDMMGMDLSFLSDIDILTVTADKNGDQMPISVQLCFTNEDSAQQLKGLLDVMMPMISGGMLGSLLGDMGGLEATITSLLETLVIGQDSTCIEISLTLTISLIEELMQDLEGFEMPFDV